MTLALAVATVATALRAATAGNARSAITALWACALVVGALFLLWGFEYLAIATWIASTLSCLGFVFFASLVGDEPLPEFKATRTAFACLAGVTFGGFLSLGVVEDWSRGALFGDLLKAPDVVVRELGPVLLDQEGITVLFFSLTVCFVGTLAATLGRDER